MHPGVKLVVRYNRCKEEGTDHYAIGRDWVGKVLGDLVRKGQTFLKVLLSLGQQLLYCTTLSFLTPNSTVAAGPIAWLRKN